LRKGNSRNSNWANILTILYNKTNRQGTGLGLSLSYDIIKAHGGELKVEMEEGQGAQFIFSIPVNQS
jgi:signal transduction histidine kinase